MNSDIRLTTDESCVIPLAITPSTMSLYDLAAHSRAAADGALGAVRMAAMTAVMARRVIETVTDIETEASHGSRQPRDFLSHAFSVSDGDGGGDGGGGDGDGDNAALSRALLIFFGELHPSLGWNAAGRRASIACLAQMIIDPSAAAGYNYYEGPMGVNTRVTVVRLLQKLLVVLGMDSALDPGETEPQTTTTGVEQEPLGSE
jgi:hypothetical protein